MKEFKNLRTFEEFSIDSIEITSEEKRWLFSKLESTKKRRAISNKNDIYLFLTSEKTETITSEFFIKILDSLEYTVKKRLRAGETLNNTEYTSILSKLPSDWIGIKFSRIK